MNPDRKTIIEHVWAEMYARRCSCGRCDCVSSDPVEIARRVLFGFGQSYLNLARMEHGRAEVYASQTQKLKRKRLKYDWVPVELAKYAERQARHERNARMYDRAARRFFRLWRGRSPFVAHPEDREMSP